MGGTELVASVSLQFHEWEADWQLFAECKPDSNSPLCVEHPDEIGKVISLVGLALVIKGCLTIVTFGIKLPGMFTTSS